MMPLKSTPIWDGYRRGGAQGAPIAEIDVIADIARDREGKTNGGAVSPKGCSSDRSNPGVESYKSFGILVEGYGEGGRAKRG
jgi:hypothetical protein